MELENVKDFVQQEMRSHRVAFGKLMEELLTIKNEARKANKDFIRDNTNSLLPSLPLATLEEFNHFESSISDEERVLLHFVSINYFLIILISLFLNIYFSETIFKERRR